MDELEWSAETDTGNPVEVTLNEALTEGEAREMLTEIAAQSYGERIRPWTLTPPDLFAIEIQRAKRFGIVPRSPDHRCGHCHKILSRRHRPGYGTVRTAKWRCRSCGVNLLGVMRLHLCLKNERTESRGVGDYDVESVAYVWELDLKSIPDVLRTTATDEHEANHDFLRMLVYKYHRSRRNLGMRKWEFRSKSGRCVQVEAESFSTAISQLRKAAGPEPVLECKVFDVTDGFDDSF